MDMRELYRSLSPEDKTLYQEVRNNFRKVYLCAHTDIVGMQFWNEDDDALLDLLDIKIAVLFDRANKIESTKKIIDNDQSKQIEAKIESQGEVIAGGMAEATAKKLEKVKW